MIKKIILSAIVVAILVVSSIVAMQLISSKPLPAISKPVEEAINVKQYTTKNQSYTIEIEYPARVYARDIVRLGVQVTGQILPSDVPLKAGQYFEKGDLLVNIYDKDISASIIAQKSKFLNVLARSLPDIKVDFPNKYDKWASFFDEIDLDKPLPVLPEIETTKEKVYLSAKEVISNYYAIKQTEIVLDRYKIYAPFNGVFRDVSKEVGAIASMGSDIGTIVSTEHLELVIGVSSVEAKLLSVGKKVVIRAISGEQYFGNIARISSVVDQRTQRVMVYISLREPSMDIIEGQMVEVKVRLNVLDGVVRVAREIINKNNQIYEIIDGKLYPMDIEVLLNAEQYSYLINVEEGKNIVFESLVEPKIGTRVNVIEKI